MPKDHNAVTPVRLELLRPVVVLFSQRIGGNFKCQDDNMPTPSLCDSSTTITFIPKNLLSVGKKGHDLI